MLLHECPSFLSSPPKHISLLLIISACLQSHRVSRAAGMKVLTETTVLCFSLQVMVPGSQNNLLLKNLLSGTEYKVTVTPIYDDGEGVSVSAPGKTCEWSFPPVVTSWLIRWKCLSCVMQPARVAAVQHGEKSKNDLERENPFEFCLHTFKLRDFEQVVSLIWASVFLSLKPKT